METGWKFARRAASRRGLSAAATLYSSSARDKTARRKFGKKFADAPA
jgi:hypothetical protein